MSVIDFDEISHKFVVFRENVPHVFSFVEIQIMI